MTADPLLDYVRQSLSRGTSREQIAQSLLASGWKQDAIDAAFSELGPPTAQQPSSITESPTDAVEPTAENDTQVTISEQVAPAGQVSLPESEPQTKSHRIPLWLKIMFWVLGVPVALVILFLVTINVLSWVYPDAPPVNDSDLKLPIATVPDSQNAYAAMNGAAAHWYDMRSPTSTPAERTADTQAIISSLDTAAALPAYQDVNLADPSKFGPDTPLPRLSGYRGAVVVNGAYALQLANSNESSRALPQALVGVNVGQKLLQSQGNTIEYLVGLALKELSLQGMQAIATSTTQDSKDLVATANTLGSYADDGSGIAKAAKLEYNGLFKPAAESSVTNEGTSSTTAARASFYFHPNETIGYFADATRERIRMAEEPCKAFTSNALDASKTLLPSNKLLWPFTENLVGKILYQVAHASLASVKQRQCDGNMLLGATQLVLALKAYEQNHHGALPASLDALVPDYLTTLPKDPYSGNSYGYDAQRGVVYSVGIDRDNSGTPSSTFSLSIAAPDSAAPARPAAVSAAPSFTPRVVTDTVRVASTSTTIKAIGTPNCFPAAQIKLFQQNGISSSPAITACVAPTAIVNDGAAYLDATLGKEYVSKYLTLNTDSIESTTDPHGRTYWSLPYTDDRFAGLFGVAPLTYALDIDAVTGAIQAEQRIPDCAHNPNLCAVNVSKKQALAEARVNGLDTDATKTFVLRLSLASRTGSGWAWYLVQSDKAKAMCPDPTSISRTIEINVATENVSPVVIGQGACTPRFSSL